MPLTLTVGVSRKLGLPNYGSVGATCAVQLELEPLIFYEQETLHRRIREAFDVCRRAIEEELAKSQASELLPHTEGAEDCAERAAPCLADPGNSTAPLASERQVEFMYHLARQSRALGGQRLKLLVEQLYHRPIEELTATEASRLIDLLKEVRAGTRAVDDLFPEAAA